MTTTAPDFGWWHLAIEGRAPPIRDGQPQLGFYRTKRGVGAAIYMDGERMVCRIGDDDTRDAKKEWIDLASNPETYENTNAWFETGVWPGEAPTTQATNAPGGDELDALRFDIEAETENARDWLKSRKNVVTTADDCSHAVEIARKLEKLGKRADAWKDRVVAPLYTTYKAEQERYAVTITPVKSAVDHFKKIILAFGVEEKRKAQAVAAETARLAQVERDTIEAERLRVEKANAAKLAKAEAAGKPAPKLAPVPQAPEPEAAPEPVKVTYGGQNGRAMSVREKSVLVITHHGQALQELQNSPEVIEAVLAAAKRVHKTEARLVAGATIQIVETV